MNEDTQQIEMMIVLANRATLNITISDFYIHSNNNNNKLARGI